MCILAPRSHATDFRNVLVLHSFGRDFKPWSEYAKAIRLELERQSPWPLDIQEHVLISARSGEADPEPPFVEYLGALYKTRKPDLIISIGAPAAAFVQKHRANLFPAVPMVFTVVDQRRVQYSKLGPKDVVAAVAIDYHAAIRNILDVLPQTDHIAVVVGTSPIEVFWREEIERGTKPLQDRVKFTYYNTLSFDDILKHAASLPPNSAIFWELMIVDAAGVVHEEGKALTRLHAAANAPIFSYTDAFFGREIVGGPHVPVLEAGRQVGAVGVRLLGGEDPAQIKVAPVGMGTPKYDWRELRRWGISESRLPSNSEVLFRSPTAWEQYRFGILGAIAAALIQSGVIAWLFYEHRRRQIAEMVARGTMAELQNVNRLAAAGELSASIAHEVRQPLTAAASSAYAARNWLSAGQPNIDEARKSLDQIVTSVHRANDVISSTLAMFSSDTLQKEPVDMNELVQSVLTTVQITLRKYNISLETQFDDHLPLVAGQRVQLQQVVLNLVMNAIESMQSTKTRKLRVRTEERAGGGIRVKIEDTGVGIEPEKIEAIFKPLFTTKRQGMGMGLSICRSIIEAHGGAIRAFSRPGEGSTFEFELPKVDDDVAARADDLA
jgi:signal transduction histidine kinase